VWNGTNGSNGARHFHASDGLCQCRVAAGNPQLFAFDPYLWDEGAQMLLGE
jgi:hypothetical protein